MFTDVSEINPFMPIVHFSIKSCLVSFCLFLKVTHLFHSSSVDPDQIPHSVASDLGLQCFPMSLL